MLMGDARALLSTTFTDRIQAAFERSRQVGSAKDAADLAAYSRPGAHPGHNADVVPAVPATTLSITRDSDQASLAFTWKVEHDHPPHAILLVTNTWLREVVRQDYVVLDGFPILDITGRDEAGRPATVLAVGIAGYFDTMIHGWRAHGEARDADISWDSGVPTLNLRQPVW
jgi:hypothetical protein